MGEPLLNYERARPINYFPLRSLDQTPAPPPSTSPDPPLASFDSIVNINFPLLFLHTF